MGTGPTGLRTIARGSAAATTAALVAGVLTIAFAPTEHVAAPGPSGREVAIAACAENVAYRTPAGDAGSSQLAVAVTPTTCDGNDKPDPTTSTKPDTTTTTENGGVDPDPTTSTTEGNGGTGGGGGGTTTSTGGSGGGKSGGTTATTSGSSGSGGSGSSGGGSGSGGSGSGSGSSGSGSGSGSVTPSGGSDGSTSAGGSGSVAPSGSAGTHRNAGENGSQGPGTNGADGSTDGEGHDDERSRGAGTLGIERHARTISLSFVPGTSITMPLESVRSGLLVWTILHGLGAVHLFVRRLRLRLVAMASRRHQETLDADTPVT